MSFYSRITRPILFCFPAENVRDAAAWVLRNLFRGDFGQWLLRLRYCYRHPSLEREVFGVKFQNPIGAAAGADKNSNIYRQLGSVGFGFVEVGTVTPKPQRGSIRPRVFRLPKDRAIVNRMGFPNQGLERAQGNLRRRASSRKVVVGANIAKNTLTPPESAVNDYLKLFRGLYEYVDYFTINVTTLIDDVKFTDDNRKALLHAILDALFDFRRGQNQYRPVLLKISPNWSKEQIDEIVDLLLQTPLDGLVVAGTNPDIESLDISEKAMARMSGGGISGAPLLEKAIELIAYVSEKSFHRYPIIGSGGVMSPDDARRMLSAGASLVQIYTGLIYNGPGFVRNICRELSLSADSTIQK